MDMPDLLDVHARALSGFGTRVHAVRPDQWHDQTPCVDWDVRTLVRHLVYEQLWVPPMMAGRTIEQIGDQFEGDILGPDPADAWDRAAAAAHAALVEPGALDRTVHLSYGDRPASEYLLEMVSDLVVHGWDLARATNQDEEMDPELAGIIYERSVPHTDQLVASGLFAPPIPVPDDANTQTKLVALFGREPH